jgi:hypothetical protein
VFATVTAGGKYLHGVSTDVLKRFFWGTKQGKTGRTGEKTGDKNVRFGSHILSYSQTDFDFAGKTN